MRLLWIVLPLLVLAGLAWIRLAPSDPARWHVDPLTAGPPGARGDLRRVAVDRSPGRAIFAFDRVAMAAPRVRRLAGGVDERHITYVARTKWLRFPDYVTVKAVPAGDGADLVILGRARFGWGDGGVNAARLDRWLKRLEAIR